ncbi:hypothetical protein ACN27G_27430 [Plantactinospora sp. WMMB334]|uniref:hypothetical protein n=1 Tax=Plantactinospora sp. WMMB334 TaxID=3404119 RepID=UPI003B93F76B
MDDDRLLISLAEVAKLTGWSERSLLDDCRAGLIAHVCRKGSYSFTRKQLDALIERYTVEGTAEPESAAEREAREMEEAIRYNRTLRRGAE